jgi:tetratricopeptide (TPR) repeat protein
MQDLGDRYGRLGRHVDALAATQRAVALYREAAGSNLDGRQGLAGSLYHLGTHYSNLKKYHQALTVTIEAAEMYTRLNAESPNVMFEANLAGAQNNVSQYLDGLGRHDEALHSRTISVAMYAQLAARHPRQFRALYQELLGNLRLGYEARGMGRQFEQEIMPRLRSVGNGGSPA